jgi:hypothetical protein
MENFMSAGRLSLSRAILERVCRPVSDQDQQEAMAEIRALLEAPEGAMSAHDAVMPMEWVDGRPKLAGYVPHWQAEKFLAGQGRSFSVCPPQHSDTSQDMAVYYFPDQLSKPE